MLPKTASWQITLFGVMTVGNFVFNTTLLLTHLLRRPALRNHADWQTLNLIAICSISSIIWGLLYFDHGVLYSDRQPSFGICAVQAGYATGWSVLMSGAALSVVVKMWSRVTSVDAYFIPTKKTLVLDIILVLHPWVSALSLTLAGIIEGVRNPSVVATAGFYCYIDLNSIDKVGQGLSIAYLALLVGLEIHLAVFIRRHLSHDVSLGGGRRVAGIRLGLIVRPMLFGLYCLFALIVALVIIGKSASNWTTFLLSTMGYAVFGIYASQPHVLRAWGLGRLIGESSTLNPISNDALMATSGTKDMDLLPTIQTHGLENVEPLAYGPTRSYEVRSSATDSSSPPVSQGSVESPSVEQKSPHELYMLGLSEWKEHLNDLQGEDEKASSGARRASG